MISCCEKWKHAIDGVGNDGEVCVQRMHVFTSRLSAAVSSAQHLLDHVARHAVEEQRNEDDQQEEDDDFKDKPTIVMPENVSDRLEWVQEPDERRIWPTAAQTRVNNLISFYCTESETRNSLGNDVSKRYRLNHAMVVKLYHHHTQSPRNVRLSHRRIATFFSAFTLFHYCAL